MIKLYGSGPNFDLPDASPFVTKAETLLRMTKLPFEHRPMSFSKAPKKKIPYIDDDGLVLGDSTFIRWHLEQKYGIDLDNGLSQEQRAVAWAFEKMAEDNLYWALIDLRWMMPDNFERGPKAVFPQRACPRPPADRRSRASAGSKVAVLPGNGAPQPGGHRAPRNAVRCRDRGLSRRKALLHGRAANRCRCDDLRLCVRGALPDFPITAAAGSLEP